MIRLFAEHKVAANLLMILLFVAGGWGLFSLNTQFLPTFHIQVITISTSWPGSSAEDVQQSITVPVEDRLRNLDHVKKISAMSAKGLSYVVIEFYSHAKISDALQKVTNLVGAIPNLPQNSRKSIVSKVEPYDAVAKVLLYSDDSVSALEHWAYRYQRELMDKGIAKVTIGGIPKKEIFIGLTPSQLHQLGMTLNQFSDLVDKHSENISAGSIGTNQSGRSVRSIGQNYTAKEYKDMPIVSGDMGQLVRLMDVAKVVERPVEYAELKHYNGHPAVSLTLYRTPGSDALASANIMKHWLHDVRRSAPKGLKFLVYSESWTLIRDRLQLLIKNGIGGLLLIFVLLFLLLNYRVAWWVALGIPISISAALFFLDVSGGSINMVSMFALILTFGIIVDDTIVVAEEGVTQFERHKKSPLDAAVLGAKRMKVAVLASSLTTIAAFLPLLLLGGVYGDILIDIPQVVICVIVASLIEAFWILPNHVQKSLKHIQQDKQKINPGLLMRLRQRIDIWFDHFRKTRFRSFVEMAIRNAWVTLAIATALIIVVFGILVTGRLNFNFFPTPDGKTLFADVTFVGGASPTDMMKFLQSAQRTAYQVSEKLSPENKPIVKAIIIMQHHSTRRYEMRSKQRLGGLLVELSSPESRRVSNTDFVIAWRRAITMTPVVEDVRIRSPRADDSGADMDIALSNAPLNVLKQASLQLQKAIRRYAGVYNVNDNLPYAPDEFVFTLKPEAYHLGLTLSDVGHQVRAALTGDLVEIINRGNQEIDVRVGLDKSTTKNLGSLQTLPIVLRSGRVVPLNSICNITTHRNYDSITRSDYSLAVHVTAEVNAKVSNTGKIINALKQSTLPDLAKKYGVSYGFKGRLKDREQTLNEMKLAVVIMIVLIYIILAWVFSSYVWPLYVMAIIPLGLVGAIIGHLVMGLQLTLLSLFGFFGLTGIVINDSIILLLCYKELKVTHGPGISTIVEACCQRFRAVVLTSLTTIAGLSPLLLERSLQARFLVPMATSICFGLAVATLLILVVMPTLLSLSERGS